MTRKAENERESESERERENRRKKRNSGAKKNYSIEKTVGFLLSNSVLCPSSYFSLPLSCLLSSSDAWSMVSVSSKKEKERGS